MVLGFNQTSTYVFHTPHNLIIFILLPTGPNKKSHAFFVLALCLIPSRYAPFLRTLCFGFQSGY